jgi:phosphoadenosine phosphosulfate reductase
MMVQPRPAVPPAFAGLAIDDAEGIVRSALNTFGRKLTLSCSFGGAGGMVLVDMAVKVDPAVDVFVLDTDLLFPETYATIEAIEQKYNLKVRRARASLTLEQQATLYGDRLWERDPNGCCTMKRAVEGYDAWMTAIRRDQADTRAETQTVTWDAKFKMWKISPLAGWDEMRVLNYIFNHDVPMNPLLEQGYTSIGCTHCTNKPSAAGGRTGRWAGFNKVECGLHSLDSLEGAGAKPVAASLTVKGEDPSI